MIQEQMLKQKKQFQEMTSKLFNLTGTYHDEQTISDWYSLLGQVDAYVLGEAYGKVFASGEKPNAKNVVDIVKGYYKTQGAIHYDLLVAKLKKGEELKEKGKEALKIFESLLIEGETVQSKLNDFNVWLDDSEFKIRFSKEYCKKNMNINAGNLFVNIAKKNAELINAENKRIG